LRHRPKTINQSAFCARGGFWNFEFAVAVPQQAISHALHKRLISAARDKSSVAAEILRILFSM